MNLILEQQPKYDPFPATQDVIFTVSDRRKHLCIQKQHSNLDIRFVFTNSNRKLRKGAKSSYAEWCIKYDFRYYDRIIPEDWLKEKGRNKHETFIKFKKAKIKRG